jgi:hypothetical protein
MSKSITNAIESNGWSTSSWGGQVIARKDGHELAISDQNWARWTAAYPGGGSYDAGILEGARAIVAVLNDPSV